MAFLRRPPTGFKVPCDLDEDELFSDLSISGTKTVKHNSSAYAKRPPSGHLKKKENSGLIIDTALSDSGLNSSKISGPISQNVDPCIKSVNEKSHESSKLVNKASGVSRGSNQGASYSKSSTSKAQRPSSATVKVKDVVFEINSTDQSKINHDKPETSDTPVNEDKNNHKDSSYVQENVDKQHEKRPKKEQPASAHAKLCNHVTGETGPATVNRLAERRQRLTSAKARGSSPHKNSNSESAKATLIRKARPQSAHTFGAVSNEDTRKVNENISHCNDKKRQRPQSAHNLGRPPVSQGQENVNIRDEALKPSVFGFKYNRHVYGSNTSIGCSEKTDENEFCLYKLAWQPYIDYQFDGAEKITQKKKEKRLVPSSLEVLQPWLTCNISENITGVQSKNCLIFLPSLKTQHEDLPVVPAPADPFEDLPYKEEVIIIPEEPKKQRKYKKSAVKNVEKSENIEDAPPDDEEVDPDSLYPQPYTSVYRYRGRRTVDEVRREILELENLMQGIGTIDGSSLIVRYQAEITNLQLAVRSTLSGVEDRVWDRLRQQDELPSDYFGFRAFSKEHDEMMRRIRAQHSQCVQELAQLERLILTGDQHRHFS